MPSAWAVMAKTTTLRTILSAKARRPEARCLGWSIIPFPCGRCTTVQERSTGAPTSGEMVQEERDRLFLQSGFEPGPVTTERTIVCSAQYANQKGPGPHKLQQ